MKFDSEKSTSLEALFRSVKSEENLRIWLTPKSNRFVTAQKNSRKFINNFLSNSAHRQTNTPR